VPVAAIGAARNHTSSWSGSPPAGESCSG